MIMSENRPIIRVRIGEKEIKALLDTGCTISMISASLYTELNKKYKLRKGKFRKMNNNNK